MDTRSEWLRRDRARSFPSRSHPLFAAVYDGLTAGLERDVLGPRRARLLAGLGGQVLEVGAAPARGWRISAARPGSSLPSPIRRPMVEAVARPE